MIGSIQGTCAPYVYTPLGESQHYSGTVRISEVHEGEDGYSVGLACCGIKGPQLETLRLSPEIAVNRVVKPTLRSYVDLAGWRQIVNDTGRIER